MSDLQKQMIEFATMDLVSAIASTRGLTPAEAMAVVYKSPFFVKLQDPETGLYRESKDYLNKLFSRETKGASTINEGDFDGMSVSMNFSEHNPPEAMKRIPSPKWK